jgi:RNA polymerase sigma factor (sigma-70 family)
VVEVAALADPEEAYRRYAEELTRFATGLVGPSDAPDVVSAATLRCFTSEGWPAVSDQRAYLFRAVLNEARQVHRSSRRRARREAKTAPRESSHVPEPRPEVLAAVARLSLRQRAVVVLTYWADLDPAAVAVQMGISEGSVRRHLARARAHLRKDLRD